MRRELLAELREVFEAADQMIGSGDPSEYADRRERLRRLRVEVFFLLEEVVTSRRRAAALVREGLGVRRLPPWASEMMRDCRPWSTAIGRFAQEASRVPDMWARFREAGERGGARGAAAEMAAMLHELGRA